MPDFIIDKQSYVIDASIRFRLAEKEILRIVEPFDKTKIEEYEKKLKQIRDIKNEALVRKPKNIVFIPNQQCPICGSKIFNDWKWFGRKTHILAWRCESAGSTHFIQWKANEIVSNQNRVNIKKDLPTQDLPFKENYSMYIDGSKENHA